MGKGRQGAPRSDRFGRALRAFAAISSAGAGPARLGARAGISGVRCSPHTFRHTFATRYLLLGGDLLTLARLLGHSPHSLELTQRYVTLLDADLRAAHKRFSPGMTSRGSAAFARRGAASHARAKGRETIASRSTGEACACWRLTSSVSRLT